MSQRFLGFTVLLALCLLVLMGQSSRPTHPSQTLHRLISHIWAYQLKEFPVFASEIGEHGNDDKLPAMSFSALHHRALHYLHFLKQLRSIPVPSLSETDHINLVLLQRWLKEQIAEYQFAQYEVPITNREGFHISFPDLWRNLTLTTEKNYWDYIARLRAFKRYTQEHILLLQRGIRSGRTLPKVVMQGYEKTISPHIVKRAEKSLTYQPFAKMPSSIPQAVQTRLRNAARQAIMTSVVPAYRMFLRFMTRVYLPQTRNTIGVAATPQGKALYQFRVYQFTNLPLTPAQIHQTGLREVKRIRQEMLAVIKQVKFKGSFAAFLQYLRTNPRFYAQTPAQLLKEVSYILKQMDGQLPRLFGHLPRMPYGIREIPAYVAPRTTTAYYMPGSGDGKRAGFYYVNTYNPKSRPLYEIEALSFHEAVPGHHLQIALQQELQGLPPFRRYIRSMAFQEGWGLYAERLGLEVGFYRDPYSNFGRLTYEMWRACRLVVDTGIHMMGWSRDRAIRYMTRHTALSIHNIQAEVDRYIAWPGQALAYKMGELKIRELRRYAKKALGRHFDLRQFHDEVLRHGALPLDLLEQLIKAYVKRKQMSEH